MKSTGGKNQRREEKRREEKRREKERTSEEKEQKKEDAGARKSRKVGNHSVFPMIRLAKASGAEPSGGMRDEDLHALLARSTFSKSKCVLGCVLQS